MSKVLQGVIVALIVCLNLIGYVIYTGIHLNPSQYCKYYIIYVSMICRGGVQLALLHPSPALLPRHLSPEQQGGAQSDVPCHDPGQPQQNTTL